MHYTYLELHGLKYAEVNSLKLSDDDLDMKRHLEHCELCRGRYENLSHADTEEMKRFHQDFMKPLSYDSSHNSAQ